MLTPQSTFNLAQRCRPQRGDAATIQSTRQPAGDSLDSAAMQQSIETIARLGGSDDISLR